jgi:hypothetical protein
MKPLYFPSFWPADAFHFLLHNPRSQECFVLQNEKRSLNSTLANNFNTKNFRPCFFVNATMTADIVQEDFGVWQYTNSFDTSSHSALSKLCT